MILITILVIAVLIGLNGLYVAAEFSAVSASKPRLAQMAAGGNKRAEQAAAVIDDTRGLDDFIAACQLGITLTSLILGFYGQSQLTTRLRTWLMTEGQDIPILGALSPDTVATFSILILLTIIAVLLGELIPKNLGVQRPEQLLLLCIAPMIWSMWLFRPLIWFFNGSGALILRLFGASSMAEHAHVHSPEEIQMLVEESSEGGVLDQDERKLLVNALQLRDVTARKVMIPRNRMLTADVSNSPEVLLKTLASSRYSRLPLHEGTIDKIVGFVHLKDLLSLVHQPSSTLKGEQPKATDSDNSSGNASIDNAAIAQVLRPVVILPETVPVEGILESMQRDQNYMVIVADEYGGTSGMITVEDLFEEIIGEFYDEFDINRQRVHVGAANRLFVNGDIQIDDLNEWLDFNLPDEDADTIGGLIFNVHGKLPSVGDTISIHARGKPPKDSDDSHGHGHGHGNGDSHSGGYSDRQHASEGALDADNAKGDDANLHEKDPTTILEQLSDISSENQASGRDGSADTGFTIEIRVEKMQDNSVNQASFEISQHEIQLLRKHEIF